MKIIATTKIIARMTDRNPEDPCYQGRERTESCGAGERPPRTSPRRVQESGVQQQEAATAEEEWRGEAQPPRSRRVPPTLRQAHFCIKW